MKNKGVFCLSFDMELLWGRHDKQYVDRYIGRADKERAIVRRLLQLFEKYDVAATWAIIGHLFLSSCRRSGNSIHPEIARPSYPWYAKDWFAKDPGTNISKHPNWYGADIVDLIRSHPKQEIGSHSFSHIIFGHPGCSSQCAEDEIVQCVSLAEKKGIKLRSFVFPRNRVGHLSLLKKFGFTSYRGENTRYQFLFLGSRLRTGDYFLPITPKVYKPQRSNGLVNIPESLYFFSARGIRRYVSKGIRFKKIKQGIDEAIVKGAVFHLWTHPTDFADDTERLLLEFEEIMKYVSAKEKEGKLSVLTMQQIARQVSG